MFVRIGLYVFVTQLTTTWLIGSFISHYWKYLESYEISKQSLISEVFKLFEDLRIWTFEHCIAGENEDLNNKREPKSCTGLIWNEKREKDLSSDLESMHRIQILRQKMNFCSISCSYITPVQVPHVLSQKKYLVSLC